MTFNPSRSDGLFRLDNFIPIAGRDYARHRNNDRGRGKHNLVSTLSPYVRHRLITEREVVSKSLATHSLAESEKFIQEVFWRSYFKGWLENRPLVWTCYQAELKRKIQELSDNQDLRRSYERAISGNSGIECFDHWTRELIETGYLHNHARMWFASIWIFTLKLPWELGADFFLRHLLDGDPASNTLSWRWVGGLHTKGKTYLARPDNINRFTDGRFNPQGQLSPIAEPLIETVDVTAERGLPQTATIPEAPFLFLVHEDDCHPESLLPKNIKPSGIIGAIATSFRSPYAVDQKVKSFARAAVKDALIRCGSDEDPIEGEWILKLLDACEKYGVRNIVTAYMPVGPSAQALEFAKPQLDRAGVTISQLIRPWDRLIWPYADRGFFKVKKKIPKILDDLHQHDLQGELI